jgi:4-hydroxybenzoate polyprenyltransferase
MEILRQIFVLLVVLSAIPAGLLLSKVTKEELKSGRKAFKLMIMISFLVLISSFFLDLDFNNKTFIIASMLFILILAYISLKKS